jgi:putative transposase
MCAVLGVSVSGYYDWSERPISQRAQANEALVAEIRQVYAESGATYGSPRIHKELWEQGRRGSRKRVERLMRKQGMRAKCKRRRKGVTTDSHHSLPGAANQLNQDFQAEAPNQKWLADITYIPTTEGWLYLAGVLDLFSRKIVGWAMAETMNTTQATAWLAASLGSGQSVGQPGLPSMLGRPSYCGKHEPHGQLL